MGILKKALGFFPCFKKEYSSENVTYLQNLGPSYNIKDNFLWQTYIWSILSDRNLYRLIDVVLRNHIGICKPDNAGFDPRRLPTLTPLSKLRLVGCWVRNLKRRKQSFRDNSISKRSVLPTLDIFLKNTISFKSRNSKSI